MRQGCLGVSLCTILSLTSPAQAGAAAASFVDEADCAGCHQAEHAAWTGSHHDLAMQDATEGAVLGDFAEAHFAYADTTSRFSRRGAGYVVTTDGADGALTDFPVRHVFGVDPLQQVLLEQPGGRLQALSIAWDTQRKRWFHLYPGARIDHRDELHWTAPAQNWNHMCGECHATDYRKNYDAATDRYATTAARFDVGCQACHGPASRHVDSVQAAKEGGRARSRADVRRDFDVDLAGEDPRAQIDTCARCHSRRGTLWGDYRHGKPLLDTHLPALLSEGLYHADGQIEGEVYEYGSFLQSRMHAQGVRCGDCHEAHSTRLRAPGDALCTTCHNAVKPKAAAYIDTSALKRKDYTSPAHHFHATGQPGSHCVDCHAPAVTYMVIDPRHDHSFRIPRPDVSAAIGTPNACNICHTDQAPQWAAAAVVKWYGDGRRREAHYGVALDTGRRAQSGAVAGLAGLTSDSAQAAIVRATALDLLSRYPGRATVTALQRGLGDDDPLVRRAAVTGYEGFQPADRIAALLPLQSDPVRAVRIEAARLLAPVSASLSAQDVQPYALAIAEFERVQADSADRPEAHVNLGNLFLSRGDVGGAADAYRKAIALDPRFIPAYVNFADVYRGSGNDDDAEAVLRDGLRVVPNGAALHEALGLTLVRQGRSEEALPEFAAAVDAAPADPRHTYVYAVALHGAGRAPEALALLEAAAKRSGDRDVLLALAAFLYESGDRAGAGKAMRRLTSINPDDPALSQPVQ